MPVTIAGERRTIRIVEMPLSNEGVAGCAIDVEDQEEARAEPGPIIRPSATCRPVVGGVAHPPVTTA